jgi:hypothetical protein
VFSFLAGFSPGFVTAPVRRGRPRVFVSHGTEDAVLPVADCGRPVAWQLRGMGYDVTYEEFADGHVVPAAAVEHALRLWRSVAATTTRPDPALTSPVPRAAARVVAAELILRPLYQVCHGLTAE